MTHAISYEKLTSYLEDLVKKSESALTVSNGVSQITDSLADVIDAYCHGRLALILGAGISRDFGLMNWADLLQNLFINAISPTGRPTGQSTAIAQCFNDVFAPSPLIAARYLMNQVGSANDDLELDFVRKVRETLYINLNSRAKSKTMDEIVRLSLAVGKNPNLHSIITYNFDDLVEKSLLETNTGVAFKSIYTPGVHPGLNELGIYHVHGYLPREGPLTPDNRIVFSERYYHEQYSQVYHWSNLVQINTFAHTNCFFIGSSLTDPNQRRLLDIAKGIRGDNRVHHHVIKIRHNAEAVEKRLVASSSVALKGNKKRTKSIEPKQLANLMNNFEEKDALSFGVGTVWVDSAAEIGHVLSQIKS